MCRTGWERRRGREWESRSGLSEGSGGCGPGSGAHRPHRAHRRRAPCEPPRLDNLPLLETHGGKHEQPRQELRALAEHEPDIAEGHAVEESETDDERYQRRHVEQLVTADVAHAGNDAE